ncbi:unnamed protein product, partial [Staurois parvus]
PPGGAATASPGPQRGDSNRAPRRGDRHRAPQAEGGAPPDPQEWSDRSLPVGPQAERAGAGPPRWSDRSRALRAERHVAGCPRRSDKVSGPQAGCGGRQPPMERQVRSRPSVMEECGRRPPGGSVRSRALRRRAVRGSVRSGPPRCSGQVSALRRSGGGAGPPGGATGLGPELLRQERRAGDA